MSKPQVLIVEDEALVGRELKEAFQALGCQVSAVVPSGEEALAQLSRQRSDLVLMDIVLRGKMDGIEAAKEIRSRWALPVVFLTAFADKSLHDLALMTQPAAILYKPVTQEQLRRALNQALFPAGHAKGNPAQHSLWPN
ncbi:MAG: response regulator [Pseudomonadota bacterium]